MDIGKIIRRVQLWKKLFPTIDAYYAVKSNCSPVICKLLASCGLGMDVASIDEINVVKNLVSDKNKIIFSHPIKPINSIVYARTVDVDNLVFDSEHELYKIKLHHPHSKLFIRLKVDDKDSLCRFSEKFGVEQDNIEFLELAHKMDLNVVGISFHVGSGCKNAKQYYSALEMAKYAFDIAEKKGFKFNTIDIGGGFAGNDSSMDLLNEISEQIYQAMNDFFNYDIENDNGIEDSLGRDTGTPGTKFRDIKLIAEPGRFFCCSSHTLVLNVIGKKIKIDKETGEKIQTIYLNDGIYGSFSAIKYDHQMPEIIPYNNDDVQTFRTRIEGSTCDSQDLVCDTTILPELEISDLVYVEEFGAYTIASSTRFNGFYVKDFFYVMT